MPSIDDNVGTRSTCLTVVGVGTFVGSFMRGGFE